jgi:hypothetical protein
MFATNGSPFFVQAKCDGRREAIVTNVCLWQILLQKSFCTADQNFSGLQMRFWNKYMRDLIAQR